MGSSSGVTFDELRALAARVLSQGACRKPDAIATLAARRDFVWEELAAHYGCALLYFEAARLEQETARLKNPSEVVFRSVGCHGVAEAAALAAIGADGYLLVEKTASARATAALAHAGEPHPALTKETP
ncbi:cobalt-precorrin 5A hydrolase [Ochrobactrum daejeonense]|uniref:Cobalt-precorrin 5A hydrolase n=1 Tax=Brucella daejeonensis TaxID=659015 RepID=A0A7W9EM35_9HYPH|nr:cobalamin biosynthesis protein [Brucella daejeonensis]MBB5701670.1 cobalt-precorrin 5A hydrolase [Brucella daejeonensis]